MKTFPQSIRGAFAFALAVAVLSACKTPDGLAPADVGTVTGRVVDTPSQLPISGATISVGNVVAVTAPIDKGGFVLRDVPAGAGLLRINATGWQRYETTITVTKNQTTDIGVIGLPSSLNQ